jgi:hypothetical protein
MDRVWLGPDFWANPLQDWRVQQGRIECVTAAMDRNVHLLTRQLQKGKGGLRMSVRLGRVEDGPVGEGQGSAGFRIAIQGPLGDYRNALFYGTGINAGLTTQGGLFVGNQKPTPIALTSDNIELILHLKPEGDTYTITLEAHDADGKKLGETKMTDLAADRTWGNIALVANYGAAGKKAPAKKAAAKQAAGAGRWWFMDWKLDGSKLEAHDDQAFGPILFSQYTLSRNVLKLTAQMPPLGEAENQIVRLQFKLPGSEVWSDPLEATIHPHARTAAFRVDDWRRDKDVPYRLSYDQTLREGKPDEAEWLGTIRRDPIDKPELVVGDVSCNTHQAFPNAQFVAHMESLNPDLLAFVGDQFYESTGGYGVLRSPLEPSILDYLRKWYIHGWTWRNLTCDRPSVSLPDDHDVYQGNIWGEAGAARHGTQEMGGYDMPADWVNVVYRTQTSHHPDPFDPTPMGQGILVFYGPMTYGRVSFAILADRMFKSGPEGKVPPSGSRGDHVVDPNFDPKTADLPGLQLLGDRQMKFLRAWADDWSDADMKAVISQTIFAAMATTHGGNRERLVADYDANGWPQTPRNEALRLIAKAKAFHIAGDQHLPAVIRYGVDKFGDAPAAFAGPAVNVGYPRWWEPEKPGTNRRAGEQEFAGDYLDHFGNKMTVLAYANGAVKPRTDNILENLEDKASGLGIVRFNHAKQQITVECWPLLADPKRDAQFTGWPVTVDVEGNVV